MTAAPIHLGPHRVMLDPDGAMHWPAQRLLALADLHLEKGSAAAARHQPVPPFDSRETLARAALLIRRYDPATLLLLGDSFHDQAGPARLAGDDLARLAELARGRRLIWILGNHDASLPAGSLLPGEAMAELTLEGLCFVHQATPPPRLKPWASAPQICGHFHPKARVPTRAGLISRPCFAASAQRLILPAFGTYTGGLDVGDPAIAALFPRGGRAFLLGDGRLFSFPLGHASEQRVSAPPPALSRFP